MNTETANMAVYDAFKEAGVSDANARAAAEAIPAKSGTATTEDIIRLEAKIDSVALNLENRLTRFLLALIGVQTAIIGILLMLIR